MGTEVVWVGAPSGLQISEPGSVKLLVLGYHRTRYFGPVARRNQMSESPPTALS